MDESGLEGDGLGDHKPSLPHSVCGADPAFKLQPALPDLPFSKSGQLPSPTTHHQYLLPFVFLLCHSFLQMFGRFNQLARHLSRPLPNYAHRSAAAVASTMTSPSTDLGKRMIHTAGCIIIGDEVLGGKVLGFSYLA